MVVVNVVCLFDLYDRLFVALSKDLHPLMKNFPDAAVEWISEPRWDRVYQRKSQGSARARELIHLLEPHAERTWGVIGSAWLEDLKIFS